MVKIKVPVKSGDPLYVCYGDTYHADRPEENSEDEPDAVNDVEGDAEATRVTESDSDSDKPLAVKRKNQFLIRRRKTTRKKARNTPTTAAQKSTIVPAAAKKPERTSAEAMV